LKLATLLPLGIFAAIGGGLVVALAVLWLIVGVRTLCGAWSGALFFAPCLRSD